MGFFMTKCQNFISMERFHNIRIQRICDGKNVANVRKMIEARLLKPFQMPTRFFFAFGMYDVLCFKLDNCTET